SCVASYSCRVVDRVLHSFPTRRSSDLVGLVQHLMAALGIELQVHLRVAALAQLVGQRAEPLAEVADRIVGAAKDVQGQVGGNALEIVLLGYLNQPTQQVDPELIGTIEAAQRIGNIGVHRGFIARQPVQLGAGGLEPIVEGSERQLAQQRALATAAL